jgi:hypothetical protein
MQDDASETFVKALSLMGISDVGETCKTQAPEGINASFITTDTFPIISLET